LKKRILALAIVLALAAVLAVPMAVFADSGDTTVTANTENQAITITAPTGKTNATLLLNTADQTLLDTNTGSVTSNVYYDVTAVDKMETSKAIGDAGKMVQWTGAAWGSGKIAAAVKVGSTHAQGAVPAAISNSPITIINNAPSGTADPSLISVTVTTAEEPVLSGADRYKITITFTASANT
jgi:hypothetical protein